MKRVKKNPVEKICKFHQNFLKKFIFLHYLVSCIFRISIYNHSVEKLAPELSFLCENWTLVGRIGRKSVKLVIVGHIWASLMRQIICELNPSLLEKDVCTAPSQCHPQWFPEAKKWLFFTNFCLPKGNYLSKNWDNLQAKSDVPNVFSLVLEIDLRFRRVFSKERGKIDSPKTEFVLKVL